MYSIRNGATRCLVFAMSLRRNTPLLFNATIPNVFWVQHSPACKVASDRKPQFVIGGSVIEFVDSWPHLGNVIASSNDDNLDILSRRNSLCGQLNDILCYFGCLGSITKLSLLKAY